MVPVDDLTLPEIPSGLADLMESIVAPLEQQLDQLQAHKSLLLKQVGKVSEEEVRIRKILRAAFPERYTAAPAGRPPAKGAKNPSAKKISPERLEKVKNFIIDYFKDKGSEEFIQQVVVRNELGWSSANVSHSFQMLRESGFLRLSGQQGNQKFFKMTDNAKEEYGIVQSAA